MSASDGRISGNYATTLCSSMILGRDWLEGNKAHMSFNPVMLKLGGKEIPLENCMKRNL